MKVHARYGYMLIRLPPPHPCEIEVSKPDPWATVRHRATVLAKVVGTIAVSIFFAALVSPIIGLTLAQIVAVFGGIYAASQAMEW